VHSEQADGQADEAEHAHGMRGEPGGGRERLRALQRFLVRVRTGGRVEDEQDPGDRERGGSHPDAVPVNDVGHDGQQSLTSCSRGAVHVETARIRRAWHGVPRSRVGTPA
jgi:hypothetical protein